MNRHVWLLALAQGLFLTNNVAFIAINGLVGWQLAPVGWMATLPVMGYVVGGALSAPLVSLSQRRWGRKNSFRLGVLCAFLSTLLGAWAVSESSFIWLVTATVCAGYFNANAQLYRFAAAEVCAAPLREKAVSIVMAGGLLGAIVGPNLSHLTQTWTDTPFSGTYLALAGVAVVSWCVLEFIHFPPHVTSQVHPEATRSLRTILLQPVFLVATLCAALSYGVMNLLMAATPLAMKVCEFAFKDTAWVLQWHVIGMFAPGFVTGHLIKRWGPLPIMGVGIVLNVACIAIALSGQSLDQFVYALTLLGIGWNFLFTGSTTLAMRGYRPDEKDRAQGAINFFVFAVMAVSSFSSGALVTQQGWSSLNWFSLAPVSIMAVALLWLSWLNRATQTPHAKPHA
jgi:MFS family permease